MNFALTSLPLALAALGLLMALILLFYLFRPPPLKIRVPADEIWRRLRERQKRQRIPWRWWLSLFLSLLIGSALLMAILRFRTSDGTFDRIALIVDTGPSMAALGPDGVSRFDKAKSLASELIGQAPTGRSVVVADTAGSTLPLRLATADDAQATLDALELRSSAASRTFSLPKALTEAELPTPLHTVLITDGVGVDVTDPDLQRSNAEVISVFQPIANVAIERFAGTAASDGEEAILVLVNHSPRTTPTLLEVSDTSQATLVRRTLELEAGERWTAAIDLAGANGDVVATILPVDDGFPNDNTTRIVRLGERDRDLLIVSDDSTFASDLVAASAESAAKRLRPRQAERAELSPETLIVADSWAPEQPPTVPLLLFDPPARDWLPQRTALPPSALSTARTGIRGFAPALPIELAFSDVTVARLTAYSASSAFALAESGERAVLLGGRTPSSWLLVPFRLQGSDLENAIGWPVFWQAALDWLSRPNEQVGGDSDKRTGVNPNASSLANHAQPEPTNQRRVPWRIALLAIALVVATTETWTLGRRITE